MNRKLWLLAGVSILAACSGDPDSPGMVDTADTAPPSVTLTPSSATIEGGETVAITATANDAVDGAITPTLSCSAGTLTGNLLVTAAVAADTTITCTGTATDKAGNRGTATTTITVKATVARVTSESGSTLAQGQFGAFSVDNLPLTADSYAAKLGDRNVTLYRNTASTLNFIVPRDMPAGQHRLDFQIGTRRYSYTITVNAAPTVGDPKGLVTSSLNDAIAGLDAFLAANAPAMTSAQRNSYLNQRSALTTALDQVDTMPAADLAALASMLQVNLQAATIGSASARATPFADNECAGALTNLGLRKAAVIVGGIGLGFIIVLDPEPLSKIAAGVLFWKLIIPQFAATADAAENAFTKCVVNKAYAMLGVTGSANLSSFVQATAVADVYGFTNKQGKSFTLQERASPAGEAAATLATTIQQLRNFASRMEVVPAATAAILGRPFDERTRIIPSSDVTLGSVSDPNILGVKSGSGDTITLTFSYVGDPPSENVPFNFTLQNGATPIPLSGQLVVALPGAEDAAVTLIQGKSITSQLQVRGAESIEIVKAPAKGAATISPSGVLSYTPTGQAFGSDEIQYRARNANGASRIATVLLTINRQFEGSWAINIRSITESQSPAGICPNENKNVTVLVSKVSDTQYSATYDGFPLTFTMAGKDDPNGLRAQVSGSYDDGPGETTESLTINIPNSSQLNGGSTWSYVGPGARCSGRTEITGTK